MTELQKYVDGIRDDLKAIYNGTTTEQNDDGEPATMYDWSNDALDYEFTISSTGDVLGVRVYVTLGGPNVWVDTRNGVVGGAWGTDRAEAGLPDAVTEEINGIFADIYSTMAR